MKPTKSCRRAGVLAHDGAFGADGHEPGAARKLFTLVTKLDTGPIFLPAIRVPKLILQRFGDKSVRVATVRHLTEHLPAAKYVDLSRGRHKFFPQTQVTLLGEVREFLTSERAANDPDRRVLTMMLLCDIVDSATHASLNPTLRGTGPFAAFNGLARACTRRV